MAAVSRYISGLCVLIAASSGFAEEQKDSTLSFSGKGKGPIQVTDNAGSAEAVVSKPITVIQPRIQKPQKAAKVPEDSIDTATKSDQGESINAMLKQRPKRDPNRLNTAITPIPPKARAH